jgi:hypothetical protein
LLKEAYDGDREGVKEKRWWKRKKCVSFTLTPRRRHSGFGASATVRPYGAGKMFAKKTRIWGIAIQSGGAALRYVHADKEKSDA